MTLGEVLHDSSRESRAEWPVRATAEELLKEYKACESPDYITYVSIICWFTR